MGGREVKRGEGKGEKRQTRRRREGSRGSRTSGARRTAAGSTSPPSWTSTLPTRTMRTIKSVPRKRRVRVEAATRSGRKTSLFRKKPNKTCDERLGDTGVVRPSFVT